MSITPIGKSGKLWQLDFHPHRHGERVRRKVHGTKATAERVMRSLEERALAKQFGWPTQDETMVKDVAAAVVKDYRTNSRKSLRAALMHERFFVDLCGGKLASTIDQQLLRDWAHDWRKGGVSAGTVNRRMSFLLRGLRLCTLTPPKWERLEEAAPRTGFYEWETFALIRSTLPEHGRPVVTIEYWTGMRGSEVFGLEWTQVRFDRRERVVFIQLADSKAGEPRLIAMSGDLYSVLLDWHQHTTEHFPCCRWVCHRKGKKLSSLKTSWKNACVKLGLGTFTKPDAKYATQKGYVGPLLHDFRRTGVRNSVRAGVPDKIALKISGHKTRAVFERYNIVNEADLIEAGRRIVQHHENRHGGTPVDTRENDGKNTPRLEREKKRRPVDS